MKKSEDQKEGFDAAEKLKRLDRIRSELGAALNDIMKLRVVIVGMRGVFFRITSWIDGL